MESSGGVTGGGGGEVKNHILGSGAKDDWFSFAVLHGQAIRIL